MLVGNPPLARQAPFGDLESRGREVERQLAFLSRYFTPRAIFLNLGAGDGMLALRAAGYVERVYVLDLHEMLVRALAWPANARIVPAPRALPDVVVDIAFSDRPLELETLRHAHRSLGAGGVFFHLSRGNSAERRRLLAHAGFAAVRSYLLFANRAVPCPPFCEPVLLAARKRR
jgi:hypothetical protein